MSLSVNYVIVGGNLTRDPELKYTPQGVAVCSFNVAVNRSYTNKQTGQKVDEVSFIECVAWNRTAENVAEHLKKGAGVLVEGAVKQERWETPEGQKREKTKVTANLVHFIGRKAEEPLVVPDPQPPAF